MRCAAMVQCGNCCRKTAVFFEAPSIHGRVPDRLLVEEGVRRRDEFFCDECDSGSPWLLDVAQLASYHDVLEAAA